VFRSITIVIDFSVIIFIRSTNIEINEIDNNLSEGTVKNVEDNGTSKIQPYIYYNQRLNIGSI